jgi:putative endonuclease
MATPTRRTRGLSAYKRGLWAERLAVWFLRAKCYRILGERVKTRAGEVDILARKGDVLIIVEVKARPSRDVALEALHPGQQVRLARAAEILLARHQAEGSGMNNMHVRFDVILIVPGRWPVHMIDAWRI